MSSPSPFLVFGAHFRSVWLKVLQMFRASVQTAGRLFHSSHPENYLPWESSIIDDVQFLQAGRASLGMLPHCATFRQIFEAIASVVLSAGVETETYWGRQASGRESYLLSTGGITARADCVRSRDFSRQAGRGGVLAAYRAFGSMAFIFVG